MLYEVKLRVTDVGSLIPFCDLASYAIYHDSKIYLVSQETSDALNKEGGRLIKKVKQ